MLILEMQEKERKKKFHKCRRCAWSDMYIRAAKACPNCRFNGAVATASGYAQESWFTVKEGVQCWNCSEFCSPFEAVSNTFCQSCYACLDPKGMLVNCAGCKTSTRALKKAPYYFCRKCALLPGARRIKAEKLPLGHCFSPCCSGKSFELADETWDLTLKMKAKMEGGPTLSSSFFVQTNAQEETP